MTLEPNGGFEVGFQHIRKQREKMEWEHKKIEVDR